MGSRVLKTMLIAVLALVVGYAVAIGVGLVAFDVFDVSQREGAAAMGLAFVIGPFAAVVTAVVAATWYLFASRRPAGAAASAGQPERRGGGGRILAIAAAVVAGALGGKLLQVLLAGQSYESYLVAVSVAMAPWIGALVLGAVAWRLTHRAASPPSRG